MQTKRFERTAEETLGASGVSEISITNLELRRTNFHGIRFQGRLRADNVSADNEAHGFIIIACVPGGFDDLTETDVDSSGDLQARSEILAVVMPWSVFGGSSNPVGANTFFEWDIVMKTSRTCPRGSALQGYVISMAESAKSVIVSHALLSCFETTV